MAKRKIQCENTFCRYHEYEVNGAKNVCIADHIEINSRGCKTFKPAINYFTNKVWNRLERTNFIPTYPQIDDDLRIGLYIVGCVFDCKLAIDEDHGMIYVSGKLPDGTTTGPLRYDQIIEREINQDELMRLNNMVNDDSIYSLLKKPDSDSEDGSEPEDKPYGWLSPMGVFTPAEWATHEEAANIIICERHMEDEYDEWHDVKSNRMMAGDFLAQVKGYALIHDPTNLGYIVTNVKPLTKHQKEFLFEYFMDMGMKNRAMIYITED